VTCVDTWQGRRLGGRSGGPLARRQSASAIARRRHVTEGTVRYHVRHRGRRTGGRARSTARRQVPAVAARRRTSWRAGICCVAQWMLP
jgi:carbon monoxide dehydrogenase subunit G